MKHLKTYIFSVAVLAALFAPVCDANAWVAAGRGYGGRGFVAAGGGYHGAYYGGYHGGGCYGCGAAAGVAAGMAVGTLAGAAIAGASQPATVYVQPEVVVQQPAYSSDNMPIGTQLASLPPGSRSMTVNGVKYYQNGPTWFKPYFGSSGVYYEVVPAP